MLNQAISLGLTNIEWEAYELLLERGELKTAEIIKALGLKRGTAYKILYELEDKKLISKREKGKIIHFRPNPPRKLLELAQDREQEAKSTKEEILASMNALTSMFKLSTEKPVVSVFDGLEGMKETYMDTIRVGEPIFAVLQTHEVEERIKKWLDNTYVHRRRKNKIPAKVLLSSGDWADKYQSFDKKYLRESIMVPKSRFPFMHEVNVYGSKVSFINHKKGEALISVILDQMQIADTMRAWFELAWIGALATNKKVELIKQS